MAIYFGAGNSLEHGADIQSRPVTVVGWFKSDDVTGVYNLLKMVDTSDTTHYRQCRVLGSIAGDPIGAIESAGSGAEARTTTGYSAGTWHHFIAIFQAQNDRRIYIDGGSTATQTSFKSPGGIDNVILGDGLVALAECAMYSNFVPTSGELAALAGGYAPTCVRPDRLVAYWPLFGKTDPEIDVIGGYAMTAVGTPTATPHPRIIYPSPQKLYFVPAAAASTVPPILYHHRHHNKAA